MFWQLSSAENLLVWIERVMAHLKLVHVLSVFFKQLIRCQMDMEEFEGEG